MNTWTDSGMSEAGLVGAMLALGLDTASRPDLAYTSGHRVPADAPTRWPAGPGGRGRFPAPERSGLRTPPSYPPPPMPEPKLASDDLSGWTDGFLAGGSPLSAPTSWDEPSELDSPLLSSLGERSAPPAAEMTSMLDGLLGHPPRAAARAAAPTEAVPAGPAAAPTTAVPAPADARPADAGASPVTPPPVTSSSPLEGPLDVTELEPAQLDFELAPLDPDNLVPTMLEPTPAADRPEEPSLSELTGLDGPGLNPVVLGSLGLESMDLDASAFTPSPEFPPPTEPAAEPVPAVLPESADRPGQAPGEPQPQDAEDAPDGHRRPAGGTPRRSGGAHHRRDDDSPLSSLDGSPLYTTLSRRGQ